PPSSTIMPSRQCVNCVHTATWQRRHNRYRVGEYGDRGHAGVTARLYGACSLDGAREWSCAPSHAFSGIPVAKITRGFRSTEDNDSWPKSTDRTRYGQGSVRNSNGIAPRSVCRRLQLPSEAAMRREPWRWRLALWLRPM